MPAGVVSDVIGRTRTLLIGLAVFAIVPFAYLLVDSYGALLVTHASPTPNRAANKSRAGKF